MQHKNPSYDEVKPGKIPSCLKGFFSLFDSCYKALPEEPIEELKDSKKEILPISTKEYLENSTDSTFTHVYLKDPIIFYPKVNTSYHFPLYSNNKKEFVFTLTGEYFPEYYYIDIRSMSGLLMQHYFNREYIAYLNCDNGKCIPKDIVPSSLYKTQETPLMMYVDKEKKVYEAASVTLDFYEKKDGRYLFRLKKGNLIPVQRNGGYKIHEELRTLIKIGEIPLFFNTSQPSIKQLNKIYQQFSNYNSEEMLKEQYGNSKGYCHLRAHFVNSLLAAYSIQSFKVYKVWDSKQWATFKKNPEKQEWEYHCAAIIFDNDKLAWVFDPWVGLNQRLLSLKEWALQKDEEPRPIQVLIANSNVTCDYKNGRVMRGFTFFSHGEAKLVNIFQKLVSSAIPNPIMRPLPNFGIFKMEKKHEINKNTQKILPPLLKN